MTNPIFVERDTFHPAILPTVEKEIARLQSETPPFDNAAVRIVATNCEFFRGRPYRVEGYAATNSDYIANRSDILMLADLWGIDGHVDKLYEILKGDVEKGFHGSMEVPEFVIAHEYGHAFEAMVRRFAEKNYEVASAYEQLVIPAINQVTAKVSIRRLIQTLLDNNKESPSDILKGIFPTVYAATNRHEFFAEMFALRVYGNEEEKSNVFVRKMDNLVRVVYDEARKEGLL